ncbi:flavodoxin [Halobacillus sp. K22]|uniref:flavodoxin n=1 Tax=Halobacillus sp. K22 TaxID=3457431 RepID=UPI003FCE0F7B
MNSILLGFASMSGNTEEIADVLKDHLENRHFHVTLEEIDEMEPEEFKNYSGVLIGSYTWNDGDLPYEVEDFYEEVTDTDLSGVPVAVFGSGDSIYPQFCEAVNQLEGACQESGAIIVSPSLKIEHYPESNEDLSRCENFAAEFASYLISSINSQC